MHDIEQGLRLLKVGKATGTDRNCSGSPIHPSLHQTEVSHGKFDWAYGQVSGQADSKRLLKDSQATGGFASKEEAQLTARGVCDALDRHARVRWIRAGVRVRPYPRFPVRLQFSAPWIAAGMRS